MTDLHIHSKYSNDGKFEMIVTIRGQTWMY